MSSPHPRTARRGARRTAVLLSLVALAGCTSDGDAGPSEAPAASATASETVDPVLATLPVAPSPMHPTVDEYPAGTVVVDNGTEELMLGVRIADTSERRAHGMMEVGAVPPDTGMWFQYPEDNTGGYWMKDVLVSLDIAWVDADDTVVSLTTMVPCVEDPCTTWDPDVPYRGVLETRAGWLSRNDVGVGDTIRLVAGGEDSDGAQDAGATEGEQATEGQ